MNVSLAEMVVMIVVRANWGENNSAILGRFSVPCSRF